MSLVLVVLVVLTPALTRLCIHRMIILTNEK